MKTAIGYLRTNDGDTRKLRQQRARIEEWAARTGHVVIRYHADECLSGNTEPKRCQGLQSAIAGVAAGGTVLAVSSVDRISRSSAHLASVAQRIERFGGRIEAAELPPGATACLLSLSALAGAA